MRTRTTANGLERRIDANLSPFSSRLAPYVRRSLLAFYVDCGLSEAGPGEKGRALEALIAKNRRRAFNIALFFGTAVFFVMALVLGLLFNWVGLVLALAVSVALVATAWFKAPSIVLDLSDAEAADEVRHARLFNVTAGMCAAVGVSPPELYVVDDPALNAMITGRDQRNTSLVVTQGLLDELTLVELEAVVALELCRVKNGEIISETIVVPTIGASAVLSEMADRWEWLSRLLALPTPLIESALARIHPSSTDLDIDVAAVTFTRFPPALASALEKMTGRSVLAVGTTVTAHLWAAPPVSARNRPTLARIHAPLNERVAVLQEL